MRNFPYCGTDLLVNIEQGTCLNSRTPVGLATLKYVPHASIDHPIFPHAIIFLFLIMIEITDRYQSAMIFACMREAVNFYSIRALYRIASDRICVRSNRGDCEPNEINRSFKLLFCAASFKCDYNNNISPTVLVKFRNILVLQTGLSVSKSDPRTVVFVSEYP